MAGALLSEKKDRVLTPWLERTSEDVHTDALGALPRRLCRMPPVALNPMVMLTKAIGRVRVLAAQSGQFKGFL